MGVESLPIGQSRKSACSQARNFITYNAGAQLYSVLISS